MSEDFRVILQPEAAEGMESAYRWIEAHSPHRARKWINGLMQAIASLEVFPSRCAFAPENEFFEEEIRQCLYGERQGIYRILFTIRENTVHILHIRHGAQEWVRPDLAEQESNE
jgi:plasmid stabilization system protein ParE